MMQIYMFSLMRKNVKKMELFFIKLSLMIKKDIEKETSGVSQLAFIARTQINLCLVTKSRWTHQCQIILCIIQWLVRRIQMSHSQFFATAGRWGILIVPALDSLCFTQMKIYLGKLLFKIWKFQFLSNIILN